MLEQELGFEREVFLLLNGYHSPFSDQFFWLFSSIRCWIFSAVVFIIILFYKHKNQKEALLILLAVILVATLCDQFSSGFCKPFFHRFRPAHHPDFMNEVQTVFDYRGGRYGFISSHAANALGFASLTARIFKYKIYTFAICLWAIIDSYTRIYLGVHFISDVVAGMLAGLFFGWMVYRMYILAHNRLINKKLSFKRTESNSSNYPKKRLNAVLYALSLTLVIMFFISMLYSVNYIQAVTIK